MGFRKLLSLLQLPQKKNSLDSRFGPRGLDFATQQDQ
jgi:hypothetical protein